MNNIKKRIVFLIGAITLSGTLINCDLFNSKEDEATRKEVALLKTGSLNFASVTWEGYWYSRYNLGALVMAGGMGQPGVAMDTTGTGAFMDMAGMMKMVKMAHMAVDADFDSTKLDPMMRPSEMYGDGDHVMTPIAAFLPRAVFTSGKPKFLNNSSSGILTGAQNMLMDSLRWLGSTSGNNSGVFSAAAQGWTIVKEVEWGRQFHVSEHFGLTTDNFGAQQRFSGMVLMAEAGMQLMDFAQNMSKYPLDNGGAYAMLIAASDFYKVVTDQTNYPRYYSQAQMQANKLGASMSLADLAKSIADNLFSQIDVSALNSTRDLSLAIQSLTWYDNWAKLGDGKAKITQAADKLKILTTQTAAEKAYVLRALLDANRLNLGDYSIEIEKVWEELKVDYTGEDGYFTSSTTLSVDEVGVILGALNSLRNFGNDLSKSEAVDMLVGFFEATTVALQQAVIPKPILKGAYEQVGSDDFFYHPKLNGQFPPLLGVAPVFGTTIKYENGKYTLSDDTFTTAGAMHLANEMIWFHSEEINGFPGSSLGLGGL